VTFAVNGPGAVIGVGNGDPSCHEPDKASERSAFNGVCMAIVQSKRGQAGQIAVTLTATGLEPATVAVTSAAGSMIPAVE
jgi:beta-galactosidase